MIVDNKSKAVSKMLVFNTDLDNTMIFSYKNDIGKDKVNVEKYQGREISYVTRNTYDLLKKAIKKMLFVPTTTRTVEQYNRIDLGIGLPEYALVCNGGVLLINGKEDDEWYGQSLSLIKDAKEELQKAYNMLEHDKRRTFDLRFIRELFVFTKCNNTEQVVFDLMNSVNLNLVDVFSNKMKVYVVPKALSKGEGVRRFKDYIGAKRVIAAGDSEFDISMLEVADIAVAPKRLIDKYDLSNGIIAMPEEGILSDEILKFVLKECKSVQT